MIVRSYHKILRYQYMWCCRKLLLPPRLLQKITMTCNSRWALTIKLYPSLAKCLDIANRQIEGRQFDLCCVNSKSSQFICCFYAARRSNNLITATETVAISRLNNRKPIMLDFCTSSYCRTQLFASDLELSFHFSRWYIKVSFRCLT